jgi:prepilin-type N-terminal cleavage/methylation domain-containing protein
MNGPIGERETVMMPMKSKPGFTLLEMLVTITVIAVVAVSAAPLFGDDNRLRVMAASSVLSSDIELAQVMTISFPDQPVVVKFDPDAKTYWLAYASDPDTPLPRADTGEPYRVVLGEGRAITAQNVAMALVQVTNDTLAFSSEGGLTDFTSQPSIQLRNGNRAITLSIAPTTGTISELDSTIEDQPKEGDPKQVVQVK